MTVKEQLQGIIDRLERATEAIRQSLLAKSVIMPESERYSDVPSRIDQIFKSDFEFIMNFQLIEQVGSPYIPESGQAAGGFDYEFTNDINVPSDYIITFDYTTPITQLNASKQGWQTFNSDIDTSISFALNTTTFNFNKLDQLPEVINYVDPNI